MPPTLRSHRGIKTKPATLGWFDLPSEIRETIIDFMDPKTRCRFAECSKMCEEEAKKSKNYLYEIKIYGFEYPLAMDLFFNAEDCGFQLEFFKANANQTIVVYKYIKYAKLEFGEPEDVRIKYLNGYLEKYKNSIRSLDFYETDKLVNFVIIGKLKRLEKLCIHSHENEIVGKMNMEQFSRIKELCTYNIEFTFEQFAKFTGEKACFRGTTEEFNTESVLNYLKMRRDGKVHENLKFLGIRDVTLDVPALRMGLGIVKEDEYQKTFKFCSTTIRNKVFTFEKVGGSMYLDFKE